MKDQQNATPWLAENSTANAPAGPGANQIECGQPDAGFPDGFQGACPLFAAVPLGDPGYQLAATGATTYVAEKPVTSPEVAEDGTRPGRGRAAFPGRGRPGAAADAVADGEFTRYEGLTGYYDCTPARAQAKRETAGTCAAMLAEPEWPADARMAAGAGQ